MESTFNSKPEAPSFFDFNMVRNLIVGGSIGVVALYQYYKYTSN